MRTIPRETRGIFVFGHSFPTVLPYKLYCVFTGEPEMIDRKSTKALLTGLLNNDDAEIRRVVDACFEARMKKELEGATKAVFESIGNPGKPIVG